MFRLIKILLLLLIGTIGSRQLLAQESVGFSGPGSHEKLRLQTINEIKNRLLPLLSQYCRDACSVIDIRVNVEEAVAESDDLGFEAVVGEDLNAKLYVDQVTVEIQVDDRVTAVNRNRMLSILRNNLQNIGDHLDILWRPVTLPQIGQSAALEEQLKRQLAAKVSLAIEKVIDAYCPDGCILSSVAVDGKLITPDEAQGLAPENLIRDKNGNAILKVDNVDIEVAMDTALDNETRNKIENLLRARTKFVAPIQFEIQATAFPESHAKQKQKEQQESADPFGLNKLRETLKIFRDLASTKEILTTTTNNTRDISATNETSTLSATTASQRENTLESSQRSENASVSSRQLGEFDVAKWAILVGALIIVCGLVLLVVLRFSQASRDAKMMMQAIDQPTVALRQGMLPAGAQNSIIDTNLTSQNADHALSSSASGLSTDARKEMSQRIKIADMKDELIKVFIDQPRVAKETFSRLLQEEGIEAAAKYVHIFGHLVIFELLGDPNLQRGLYELSEFYHKSDFDFKPEEEIKLLAQLKTRVTANEIRVLARKQMDKFEFLSKLDAAQIYNLLIEEKPQVQSIVLTQLDHKRRRAIFDMYHGESKVNLMRELCRADAIPKEYLSNVAKALEKKVTTRPEFDTENLRSNDILLELMEKADLDEQRALMRNLQTTNVEAARSIKLKLVTVEVMPYLKDGHLLELVIGLERDDLLTFLAGTRDHIRALLLAKAPEELADSWLEDLANIKGISEQNFRLVELKVLNRIRSLVNNGVVNLLEVNDLIFAESEINSEDSEEVYGVGGQSAGGMVA